MKSRLSDHLQQESFNSSFISTDFSPYAKNQVKNILNRGIDDQAVCRKNVEAITIDGISSLDLDDAIWAERTKTGYCVWIHIADVAEAIPIFSPLDREALQRATSIYRRDHIINMFPTELSTGPLSLDEDGIKKTMTLQMDLDENCHVKNSSFYESNFKNLKRYDYENFGDDYVNQDSDNYSTLHLFKEISDKLRINRLKTGGIVGYREDDRRIHIGQKHSKNVDTYSQKVSHDIIEAFMVLANITTGNHLVKSGVDSIFKQHVGFDERSFYIHKSGHHFGLGVDNYTHFTSPIRRYVDVVIHRILKALDRNEIMPYGKSDLKFISVHSNNTRLKIETVGGFIDFEYKGEKFLEKTEDRLGRPPEVNEMKHFIKNNIHKGKKMPKCMKEAIKEKIENSNICTWAWVIGVILFGKDKDLKEFLKQKVLTDKVTGPGKILNILDQTQIIRGEEAIFDILEKEKDGSYTVEVYLHKEKISGYSSNVGKLGSLNTIKGIVRWKVLNRVFDYFINL